MVKREEHWERVYAEKAEGEVSWFQASPDISVSLIEQCGIGLEARIIDVGGGSSRLVDVLLEKGFRALSVLDISDSALDASRKRLGQRASGVSWMRMMR